MGVLTYEETRNLAGVTPQEAFDFVSNVDNIPRYISAVLSAEAEGDPGTGRIVRSTSSMMGLKLKGEQTVTAHEAPSLYRIGGDDPFPTVFEYRFEEAGDGTNFTLSVEIEPKGLPVGGLVVGRFLKKQINDMADAIVELTTH